MIDLPAGVYMPAFGALVAALGFVIKMYNTKDNQLRESEKEKLDLLGKHSDDNKELALNFLKEGNIQKLIIEKVDDIHKMLREIREKRKEIND